MKEQHKFPLCSIVVCHSEHSRNTAYRNIVLGSPYNNQFIIFKCVESRKKKLAQVFHDSPSGLCAGASICVCVSLSAALCPLAVLTPAVCLDCVLNACSSYPCHSGHRPGVYRRIPGVAQLEETEHQKHELRQPRVPQDHRGRRRRDPHRPQRANRPRLPCCEWQCQTAVPSTATGGRYPRPGSSLVHYDTYAFQCEVN